MLEPETEETKDLESKIYNKDWDWYRLGDTYYRPDGSMDLSYHVDRFPDSIASEYIKQSSSRSGDLDTIKKIIKKEPIKYETVIHIRIGDVICYGQGFNYSAYENPQWWEQLTDYLIKKEIKNVYVIAGSHTSICLDKSARYILNRIHFLKEKGLNVTYEPGKPPDEDLVIAVNSKNFISTGGYYGKLMSEIVKANGGNVITIDIEPDSLKHILIYFIVNIVITFMLILFFSYTKL
jgi:hypothetical protein